MRDALREISLKIYIFRDTDTAPAVVFCWTSQKIFLFSSSVVVVAIFSHKVSKKSNKIFYFFVRNSTKKENSFAEDQSVL
jgi:hypothetical protein